MKKSIKTLKKIVVTFLMMSLLVVHISCEDYFEFDLPEANSIVDTELPMANFTYTADINDFKKIIFTDLSAESTTYFWDFGNGATSNEQDPIYIFEDGEGVYPVTLTTSDANGASDSVTIDVMVVEPEEPVASIPVILEAGFDNGNNSRDPWRNSALGGVIQITSSGGYYEGSNGAKLPSPGSDRIGYQLISEFTPNHDYILTFKYRMKDNVSGASGLLHVKMLTATDNPADIQDNTVASVTFSEAVSGTSDLLTGVLTFNSGANTSLAIFFYNEVDEAYIDSFEIDAQ